MTINHRKTPIYFQVDDADPPFPRPAGYWWFGCDTLSQPLKMDNTKILFDDDQDNIINDEYREEKSTRYHGEADAGENHD